MSCSRGDSPASSGLSRLNCGMSRFFADIPGILAAKPADNDKK